jgi:hypothetical protein
LIEKYQADKKDQDTKVLIDNKYSFEYRKEYTKYEKRFSFYPEALEQLTNIIADEKAFYVIQD